MSSSEGKDRKLALAIGAIGVARAYAYAGAHREQYAEFFEGGSLAGPGLNDEEADRLPASLRIAGVVV